MLRWGKQQTETPLKAAHIDFTIQVDSCSKRFTSIRVKPHLQAMSANFLLLFKMIWNPYLEPQVKGIVAEDNKVNKFINWMEFKVCSVWWTDSAFSLLYMVVLQSTLKEEQWNLLFCWVQMRICSNILYCFKCNTTVLLLKKCLQSIVCLPRNTEMLTGHWILKLPEWEKISSNRHELLAAFCYLPRFSYKLDRG